MREIKNLHPIGSVVHLKGAKKDLMVFGICQTNKETGKDYDYIGVLWPEGSMGPGTQVLFAHDDIENVVFTGHNTPEREAFIEKLSEFYESCGK